MKGISPTPICPECGEPMHWTPDDPADSVGTINYTARCDTDHDNPVYIEDECTLAADDGELFVTPQAPRELSLPRDNPPTWDAMEAQRQYRLNE